MKDFNVRKYTIRFRKKGLKAPKTKRSKRAIVTLKQFIEKNTRVKRGNIIIGEELNNYIWEKGITNPPTKANVFVQKLKDDKVFVNLEGKALRIEEEKKDKKTKDKNKKEEKSLEDITKENTKEEDIKDKIKLKKPSKPSKK